MAVGDGGHFGEDAGVGGRGIVGGVFQVVAGGPQFGEDEEVGAAARGFGREEVGFFEVFVGVTEGNVHLAKRDFYFHVVSFNCAGQFGGLPYCLGQFGKLSY